MLLSPADLLKDIDGQLSLLQVGYLVKIQAISYPLIIQNGRKEYLFDTDHKIEINSLLSTDAPVPESCYEKSQNTNPEYTADVLRVLKKEITNKSVQLSTIEIDDYLNKKRSSKIKRFINYLFKFRLYRRSLTSDEQLELHAIQAIATTNLIAHLVQAVAPRLVKFDSSSSLDMSLKVFISVAPKLEWGLFANELEAIEKILLVNPSIKSLPILDGLNIISELENKYDSLAKECLEYIKRVDPDRLIFKRLYHIHYSSEIIKILNTAEERSLNQFNKSLPSSEIFEKLLEGLMKKF